MSYILDALKRSEQERYQERMPALGDDTGLFHVSSQSRPKWPYYLVAVLLINALVYGYFQWQGMRTPATLESSVAADDKFEAASVAEVREIQGSYESDRVAGLSPAGPEYSSPAVNSLQAPELVLPVSPSPRGRKDLSYAEREAAPVVQAPKPEMAAQEANPVRVDSAPQGAPLVKVAEGTSPFTRIEGGSVSVSAVPLDAYSEKELTPPEATSAYESVDYLYDLEPSFQRSIPSLRFNSHIYSDMPSARRVMINNIYLSEGQSLSGMDLLEIGEESVVFRKRGTLFKLPVLRDWNGK